MRFHNILLAFAFSTFLCQLCFAAEKVEQWTRADQTQFDYLADIVRKEDRIPIITCGTAYHMMSEKEKVIRQFQQSKLAHACRVAEDRLKAMGPKAIPSIIDSFSKSSHAMQGVSTRLLESYGNKANEQIEIAVRSGRYKFTPPNGDSFHPAIMVLCASTEDTSPLVLRLAKSENSSSRLFAVRALEWMLPSNRYKHHLGWNGGIKLSDSDITMLISFMSDSDEYLRRNTAPVIAKLWKTKSEVIPVLLDKLKNDESELVKFSCCNAIEEFSRSVPKEHLEATQETLQYARANYKFGRVSQTAGRILEHLKSKPLKD
ncbi:HEAT repeat domain-containing protein [bacterium]|nr:HEAT repeat domain-containing protein [bacterium]